MPMKRDDCPKVVVVFEVDCGEPGGSLDMDATFDFSITPMIRPATWDTPTKSFRVEIDKDDTKDTTPPKEATVNGLVKAIARKLNGKLTGTGVTVSAHSGTTVPPGESHAGETIAKIEIECVDEVDVSFDYSKAHAWTWGVRGMRWPGLPWLTGPMSKPKATILEGNAKERERITGPWAPRVLPGGGWWQPPVRNPADPTPHNLPLLPPLPALPPTTTLPPLGAPPSPAPAIGPFMYPPPFQPPRSKKGTGGQGANQKPGQKFKPKHPKPKSWDAWKKRRWKRLALGVYLGPSPSAGHGSPDIGWVVQSFVVPEEWTQEQHSAYAREQWALGSQRPLFSHDAPVVGVMWGLDASPGVSSGVAHYSLNLRDLRVFPVDPDDPAMQDHIVSEPTGWEVPQMWECLDEAACGCPTCGDDPDIAATTPLRPHAQGPRQGMEPEQQVGRRLGDHENDPRSHT